MPTIKPSKQPRKSLKQEGINYTETANSWRNFGLTPDPTRSRRIKGSTSLAQLLDLAGGLSTIAQTRRATLERIENRDKRVVDQLSLDAAALARPAKDGDLITVLAISPKFENAVTLRGNVAQALRYPYREGMRVRDLIPDKEALVTRDYYLRKNLTVQLESNANRAGRGRETGTGQQAISQQRLLDEVRNLEDEVNWDYAVIDRLNETDLSTTLIPFNLGKAVLENDAAQNLALKPGDVVTVFSKRDVGASVGRRSVTVHLEGEFNHSGVYQAKPGETLRSARSVRSSPCPATRSSCRKTSSAPPGCAPSRTGARSSTSSG